MRDQTVVRVTHLDERTVRLPHERRPMKIVRRVDVDPDESRARRSLRRSNEEQWAAVAHELVHGVAGVKQLDDRRAEVGSLWIVEIDEEQAILELEAIAGRDDEILPVVADIRAKVPRWMIGCLEHQSVVRLRLAEPVVVHLLTSVWREGIGRRGWTCRIDTRVEESARIGRPGERSVLQSLKFVADILSQTNVSHANRAPRRTLHAHRV